MKEALIIIDVQNDYFPGGTCELCNAHEAEKKIQSLIQESRAQKRPVVYVQHINPPEETFFLEGTYGCEISERIKNTWHSCHVFGVTAVSSLPRAECR